MDSALVDIENVVIMWWALEPIAMAYLKSGQHDLFLSVLGNQSSHFDQPVLACSVGVVVEIFYRPIIFQD